LKTDADEKVTNKWLKSNQVNVIKYYYHILSDLDIAVKRNKVLNEIETKDRIDPKRFTLAPLMRIKSQFIMIDIKVLYHLMKSSGLIAETLTEEIFQQFQRDHFMSVFQVKEKNGHRDNQSKEHRLKVMVQTDGVSACFHYEVQKTEEEKNKNKKRKVIHSNNSSIDGQQRVIAIDPGRTNIVYGVEMNEDNTTIRKQYKLTRSHFYTLGGITQANKRTKVWQKEIENEEKVFMQHSRKTANIQEWKLFLNDYLRVYDALWESKTKKKRGRERFRLYSLKRGVLDRFFRTMQVDGETKPIIAYGNATFSPTGSGECAVPTTTAYKVCSRHFTTRFVDEFRTSKLCSCCDETLRKVCYSEEDEDGSVKTKEIRGLRWCTTTRMFRNRDLNAAINIHRCYFQRPPRFFRNVILVENLDDAGAPLEPLYI